MLSVVFFFFNDTATTEIYTLSLHDALPISSYAFQIYIPIDLDFRVGSILFTSVSRITGPHHTLVPHHLFHPPPPPRFASWHSRSNVQCHLRSEEHTSELQSRQYLVCRLLFEKKKIPHT